MILILSSFLQGCYIIPNGEQHRGDWIHSCGINWFILVGLTDDPEQQIPLFIVFLFVYLITLVGNLGMMELILLDSCLYTPMYFFLSNLSLVDFGYSSAVTPKVMVGFLTGDKFILYNACATQFFFFVAFIIVENSLLASMAMQQCVNPCITPPPWQQMYVLAWP